MDSQAIPLVVGVTGHRELREEDLGRLRAVVGEVFEELQGKYRHTPLLVLSSLAEGADRLVAEVAQARGIPFIVPLPMERKEYEKDFAGKAGSTEEFTRLMEAAEASFVVSLSPMVTEAELQAPEKRAEQYAMAGKFILRHSHILLALWDGEKGEKTGGTAQMVRYRLTGFPRGEVPEWASLFPADSGPVYHVLTRRGETRDEREEPKYEARLRKYFTSTLFSRFEEASGNEAEAEEVFDVLLRRTDTFNRDWARRRGLERAFRQSAARLAPKEHSRDEGGLIETLLERFGAADVLAGRFRRLRQGMLAGLSLMILPTSFFLAEYDNVHFEKNPGLEPFLRWENLLCFGFWTVLSGVIFVWVRFSRVEAKHLDYRALAEGLKILYFWRMAGLQDDVSAQYLRKQRSELDWIRCAIRASDLPNALISAPRDPFPWIAKAWIEDQRSYFERSARWGRRAARLWNGALLLLLVLCMSLTTLMLVWFGIAHRLMGNEWTCALLVMLAGAGALLTYIEKLGLSYQAKEYKEMARLFASAKREYEAALGHGDTQRLRAILRRLGHEALRENGDWLLLYRDRPVELPL